MFLVVASDGVWDTMTSDLVAKFVLVNTCKIVDKTLKVGELNTQPVTITDAFGIILLS